MYKRIFDVVPGDVIQEVGGGRTEVRIVELGPGSCKTKVHINEKDCYEWFSDVRVSDAPKKDR